MTRRLLKPLWILLALIFLFEAWLWARLAQLGGWIVSHAGWQSFRDQCAGQIECRHPSFALFVFVVPALLVFPIKIGGLALLASGHWWFALAVLAVAKVISFGITAFIFELTRHKLLELGWFARLYDFIIYWLGRAHELVDPIKAAIKSAAGNSFAGRLLHRAIELRQRIRKQQA